VKGEHFFRSKEQVWEVENFSRGWLGSSGISGEQNAESTEAQRTAEANALEYFRGSFTMFVQNMGWKRHATFDRPEDGIEKNFAALRASESSAFCSVG
jgi:hypothetical protein